MIVTSPKKPQSKSENDKNWFEKTADFISYLEKFRSFIIAASLLLSGYWVSDAINKASLISNSIDRLVEGGAKRDIALIALDVGINPPPNNLFGISVKNCIYILGIGEGCDDPVFDVAKRLYIEGTDRETRNSIISIMSKRKPELTKVIISQETGNLSNSSQQSNLPGIVYIQYESDKAKAEELQKALQKKNIFVPRIERVGGINKNDIRYANAADKQIAENLKVLLETKQGIGIEVEDRELIDLSEAGYRIPSGQAEIWLKD
jgi:hypothetical protein